MNTYFIFWIKEEFAHHFFYKSSILNHFLTCYFRKKDNPNLLRQYTYITNQIPKSALISYIRMEDPPGASIKTNDNKIEIYNELQYISLHIYEKHLLFQCETLQDAEELLFSTLRKFNPYFFIMGKDIENFGWISPVIKRGKYRAEQQLRLPSYF